MHAGPNLIAEYNAGAAPTSPVQEYVYADQIDSLVMIQRNNGQRLGVTRNRQWSVVGLHDLANGNVVERYAYDMTGKRTIYAANGTTVRTTSSFGNHFGYTSRWHDDESGLMYFRARYYNPLTGEFLRRDPLGFVDGMSTYRGYMGIGWVDPSGTAKIGCTCRRSGGRLQEYVVDCKGMIKTCCERRCNSVGYWTGNSRTIPRPEFAATNGASSIPSQNYVPGSGVYFSEYVFTWETPHPNDPVDLWLTRGKLGAGAVAVGATGWAAGIVWGPGAIAGAGNYGRSAYYGALANADKAPVITSVASSAAYGAAGVPDLTPDPSDLALMGKPFRKAAEEALDAADDFIRASGTIAPKTAGSHGLKDIIEGASGMKPGPAGEFFGWKGGHVTKGAADFTKDQLTKKGFTKEVLEQMADAYEAIAKQASGTGNFNPSAPSRAAQLCELIKELF